MTPGVWEVLMANARRTAAVRGERAKVVGVRLTRSRRGGWVYVVECASWCTCRSGNWGLGHRPIA